MVFTINLFSLHNSFALLLLIKHCLITFFFFIALFKRTIITFKKIENDEVQEEKGTFENSQTKFKSEQDESED